MQVLCKKGTTKLVPGVIYNVRALYNNPASPNGRRHIYIEGFSSYNVDNFTMPDGSPIPNIQWKAPLSNKYTLEPSEVKINDILVCLSDRYTHLTYNGKYKVIDIKTRSHTNVYNKNISYKYLVKFEGSTRFLEVSRYRFRHLEKSELREIGLRQVIDGKIDISKVEQSVRKIESAVNKDYILIQSLLKSAMDRNRHAMDIVDWCCNQSSKGLKAKRGDYTELLNLPLSEILKKLEN